MIKCVNALNGLIPFLLYGRSPFLHSVKLRVNALNGLIPFLLGSRTHLFVMIKECVNALNGLIPFLQNQPVVGSEIN